MVSFGGADGPSTPADTFIHTSMPVVDYYRKQGKVVDVRRLPLPSCLLPLSG